MEKKYFKAPLYYSECKDGCIANIIVSYDATKDYFCNEAVTKCFFDVVEDHNESEKAYLNRFSKTHYVVLSDFKEASDEDLYAYGKYYKRTEFYKSLCYNFTISKELNDRIDSFSDEVDSLKLKSLKKILSSRDI